jgi:hypothetical protein
MGLFYREINHGDTEGTEKIRNRKRRKAKRLFLLF